MKQKKVHVIPHTHWDREWYFNTSRSTIYLLKHIKEVLNVLENDDEFNTYILDAQTSLVEDYLEYYPDDKKRIQKLVKENRLFIGPWYTQTDQLVISQESIVRNLLYGIDKANEFGHSFKVGYVPDAFGQGGNMPQIYNSFGITNAVFWRGIADTTFPDTQFIWEGTDGSRVYTNIIRNGYHFGGEHGIPENENDKKAYIDKFIGKLDKESNTNHIYFSYGHDQAPIRENLPELVESFEKIDFDRNYVMGNPETFFTELVSEHKNDLKIFSGEFTQAKHSRVHKSIFSTRADMKQLNNKIENYIVNVLEPVLVIADNLELGYPHPQLEKIWKLMFENAAHDSIGGCNSDSTNRDILHRYKIARDLATNLLEITMRKISNKIKFNYELNIIAFNPLPYDYEGIVEIEAYVPNLNFTLFNSNTNKEQYFVLEEAEELTDYVLNQTIQIDSSKDIYIPNKVYKVKLKAYLENLNALGYQTFHIDPEKKSDKNINYIDENSRTIENSKYHIKLENNNTLTITDKVTDIVYEKQMIFIDSGDDGDSYNYSPPEIDMLITSENSKILNENVYKNYVNQRLEYTFEMNVPYDLEQRAKGKLSKKLLIKVFIDLEKDCEVIKFNVEVNNNVLSHKLSVQFDTAIASKFSYADQLFGPIRREVYLEENKIWKEEKWDEKPIAIEPMQSYIALTSEYTTFSLFTEGVREYEIIGDDYSTIQLTLFRTFGYMGKEDLLYRPGRASGETVVETPDAQLLGKMKFEFGVYINSQKEFNDVNLSKISKEFLTDIPTYQNSDFLNGRMIFSQKREEKNLPQVYNIANFNVDEIGVSAIKASEKNNGYLIRIYNPYYNKAVEIPEEFKKEIALELDETTEIDFPDKLEHNKFITVLIDNT